MQRGTALAIGGMICTLVVAAFGVYGWVALGGFVVGFMTSEVSAYMAYGRWRD